MPNILQLCLLGPHGQNTAALGCPSVQPDRPISPAASEQSSLSSRPAGTPLERAFLKLNKATKKLVGDNITKGGGVFFPLFLAHTILFVS